MRAQLLHLVDPAIHDRLVVRRDVLPAAEVATQVGQGWLGLAQVIETRAQIAIEDRHIGIVDAEPCKNLCRLLVLALLVQAGCLLGVGLAFFIQSGSQGDPLKLRQTRPKRGEHGDDRNYSSMRHLS